MSYNCLMQVATAAISFEREMVGTHDEKQQTDQRALPSLRSKLSFKMHRVLLIFLRSKRKIIGLNVFFCFVRENFLICTNH